MTFISELDLDIVVTYLQAKNEVNMSMVQKLSFGQTVYTDRQTDRQKRVNPLPSHSSWVVMKRKGKRGWHRLY